MIKINKNGKIQINGVRPIFQNGQIVCFNTIINTKELGEVYNKLSYDGNAQRGFCEENGIKKPLIDKKHVKQIKEVILNNGNIRGHLTWNIRADREIQDIGYYTYDSKKEILTIEGNIITIPDSAHRHKALFEIYQEEKDDIDLLLNEFSLDIYNMTFQEEKDFFTDINSKGKTVCKNRTLFLSSNIKSKLLREIIDQSNLKGRIECEKERVNNEKLTKFSTLYNSLFGVQGIYGSLKINENNYNDLKEWLIKFYNNLLNARNEFSYCTMENKKMLKQNSMLLEEISWWGFAYISKQIKEDKRWKRTLNNKLNKKINIQGMESIDFWLKINPCWDSIRMFSLNKATQEIVPTNSIYNSVATRNKIQNIIALNLFN